MLFRLQFNVFKIIGPQIEDKQFKCYTKDCGQITDIQLCKKYPKITSNASISLEDIGLPELKVRIHCITNSGQM